jgi:hypothetical protein
MKIIKWVVLNLCGLIFIVTSSATWFIPDIFTANELGYLAITETVSGMIFFGGHWILWMTRRKL